MKRKFTVLAAFVITTSLVGCSQAPIKEGEADKSQAQPLVSPPASSGKAVEIQLSAMKNAPLRDEVQVKSTYYNYDAASFNPDERKALLEILNHLKQTDELIKYAQSQQNDDQRIKFRYDWLSNDLYKIERGIQDYLTSPKSQPRTVTPIMGTYSR